MQENNILFLQKIENVTWKACRGEGVNFCNEWVFFRVVVPYRIRCVCQEMPESESETTCTTTQPGRTLVRRKLDETSPAGSKSERPVRAYLGQIYRWLDRRTKVAKFIKSRSMEVLISNMYEDKICRVSQEKILFWNFRFFLLFWQFWTISSRR